MVTLFLAAVEVETLVVRMGLTEAVIDEDLVIADEHSDLLLTASVTSEDSLSQ